MTHLLDLQVHGSGIDFWRCVVFRWRRAHIVVIVIIVVSTALASKIRRTFMFVSASIVLKAPNGIVDVSGAELVKFLVVSKYDDSYIDLTENSQLKRLLE